MACVTTFTAACDMLLLSSKPKPLRSSTGIRNTWVTVEDARTGFLFQALLVGPPAVGSRPLVGSEGKRSSYDLVSVAAGAASVVAAASDGMSAAHSGVASPFMVSEAEASWIMVLSIFSPGRCRQGLKVN